MISPDQVRAFALALPEVEDKSTSGHLAFAVAGKGFAWSWMERARVGARRQPRLDVLAVRAEEKEMIVEADPSAFVCDDHYRGFPAVLVRLDRIAEGDLAALLAVAWRCQAPRALIRAVDAGR
ncbi:MAG TPA: MmcQ/YjbR family DNA-binding protein [Caulobacter sp.]|nr:MmcQ/YjbR family DNA-binding protein [Caulobacter sp.]